MNKACRSKHLLFCVLFLFSGLPALLAQGIGITGVVTGDEGPLPGVNVTVKGTTQGATTNPRGRFSLTVPDKASVLEFSMMGYSTKEVVVGDQTTITVKLAVNIDELDKVVVVGYGTQKKATMIGSVSQTEGADLLKVGAVTTVSQAIQGLMPGVVSLINNSKPGRDAADILIRGKGTWGSTTPLFLVDGVERDFNDLDPNEIESISVLKDAAATAVYGVKGGNGVIIVTTKRGKSQRPSVGFSANFGFKQPTAHPGYSSYVTAMEMWNEAVANDKAWGMIIPESKIAAWKDAYATGNYGPNNDYFPQVDWWKEMIKPFGPQQQYNINLRGGTDFVKYFASLGYLNEGDIFRTNKNASKMYDPAFWYKRFNWRANLDFNLTKTTILSINLSGSQGTRNQPGFRMNDTADNEDDQYQKDFFLHLYSAPRNMFPIQWSDGTYGAGYDGSGNLRLDFDQGERIMKYYQNFVDLGLKQDLAFVTKGLSAQIKFSYTTESSTQSRIQRITGGNFGQGNLGMLNPTIRYFYGFDYSQPLAGGGYALLPGEAGYKRLPNNDYQEEHQSATYDVITNGGYARRMYYEPSVNYARNFGKHAVTALGVFSRYENEGLRDDSNLNMKYPEREEAWVTRVTYGYAERYLLEFNGAYTGSMRFARGKRFKFFPAYSIGWRPSEEPFVKNLGISKLLNNFKIRYSYGTVGYDRNASFFTYTQKFDKDTYTTAGAQFGSTAVYNYGPIYVEGQTANPNATWETSYKQNLGFDFGLFNSKLSGTVDLYKEKREGILMSMIMPGWFGLSNPDANLGKTKTHGVEVSLGWKAKIGRDFNYWANGNFAINENRVVFKNDAFYEKEYLKEAGKPIGVQRRFKVVGYYASLDDIYNYGYTADQPQLTPGDFMYADYNADGTLTISANPADQLVMLQQNYPRLTYGWTMGFSWKNFDFTMMWYGVSRVYKNLADEMVWDLAYGQVKNYYAHPDVLDRWTPETALTANKPALHTNYLPGSGSYNTRTSTYLYRDASYLRLKNFEIAYSFGQRLIKKFGMTKCQIYANGNNLLTFSSFSKYIDPEANSVNLYPMVRRYNIGIRLGF